MRAAGMDPVPAATAAARPPEAEAANIQLQRWLGLCPSGSLAYDAAQSRWVAASDTATVIVARAPPPAPGGATVVACSRRVPAPVPAPARSPAAIKNLAVELLRELTQSPQPTPQAAPAAGPTRPAASADRLLYIEAGPHRPGPAMVACAGSRVKLAAADDGMLPLESLFQVSQLLHQLLRAPGALPPRARPRHDAAADANAVALASAVPRPGCGARPAAGVPAAAAGDGHEGCVDCCTFDPQPRLRPPAFSSPQHVYTTPLPPLLGLPTHRTWSGTPTSQSCWSSPPGTCMLY